MTASVHGAGVAARLVPSVRADADCERALPLPGWELARLAADAAPTPAQLAGSGAVFAPAIVPGTVAQAAGRDADGLALDEFDHFYRVRFARPSSALGRVRLQLDGLATLADVWLNDRLLGSSTNMFHAHAFDVTAALEQDNELCIRFRALARVLRERKSRGRWPTRLVAERNLRFVRTTLLGYMPGFTPPVRPVGPWRGVRLVLERELAVEHVHLQATVEGGRGILDAAITCRIGEHAAPAGARLLAGDSASAPLRLERTGAERWLLQGKLVLDAVTPWWPHTHGAPHGYPARVVVALEDGRNVEIDLGAVGFRTLAPIAGDGFAVRVNGQDVFCRGACWTPLDVEALHGTDAAYRSALRQVRDAGMNMLRLPGNLIYESDAFYRICDELGIMVFQDFMFANMDYPTEDPEFMTSCRSEAEQFLTRTAGRACVTVLCGNSEVAQQAAMMGAARELWSNELFDRVLPELCARERPDALYVPSSPSGGAMPFHTGRGPTHYYGVGAYLRPIDDARLRRVQFASECLAFSNPPSDASLSAWLGGEPPVAHHPHYKQRVPRDPGAGWDFADVTDHYVELLFGVPARRLRYSDHERYLELCRVAVGEVMARVQGLWRRSGSGCHGALIWLLRDLWDGAGFGLIDSRGLPKAPYYFLKRAWAMHALWFVDEGTDGLSLHAANDASADVDARIELALYREGGGVVAQAQCACPLPARSQRAFSVEALLERFVDSSYAYRFGPPVHTLVAARLLREGAARDLGVQTVLARAFHLPLGLVAERQAEVGLSASARAVGDGAYALSVSTRRYAQAVSVRAPGFVPSDDYFDLAPGETHSLLLAPEGDAGSLRGTVRALNTTQHAAISFDAAAAAPPAPQTP
jgi:beta-mannosidase